MRLGKVAGLWYFRSMKFNTKSSVTLPPSELAMVNELMKKLKAKTKVEVIRRGLQLLKETTDRASLAEEFRRASQDIGHQKDIEDLHRELEGIDDESLPAWDEKADLSPPRKKSPI